MRETITAFLLCFGGALIANMAASQGGSVTKALHLPYVRIDGGKTWYDGRPVLGETKSWNGVILGLLAALLLGAMIMPVAGWTSFSWVLPVTLGALGAPLVDLTKSFWKRRNGAASGAKAGLMDRLDVPLGTVVALFSWCCIQMRAHHLGDPGILALLALVLVLGPPGHHLVCTLSHRANMKNDAF